MKVRYNIYSTLVAVLTLCLSFCGCVKESSDPGRDDDGKELLTRAVMISTRVPDDDVEDWEMINSWWVAFVDRTGKVVRLVTSPTIPDPTPCEMVTTTVKLPAGNYTVYAFANFSAADPSAILMNIEEGTVLGNDFEDRIWTIIPDYERKDVVPMSGKLYNVSIHPRESENIVVEVVRMVAKMKFEFYSETKEPLRLKGVTISNASNSGEAFFPDYTTLGTPAKTPTFLSSSVFGELRRDYGTGIDLSDAKTNPATDIFYMLESTAANHPTGHYLLTFDVSQNDGAVTERITALAYQLAYINRNDYITIPVRFTDRNIELGVRFYPPIGGYPASIIESKGGEFYATFGTPGAFVIIPRITDYDGIEYPASSYSVDIDIVSDPAGILVAKPRRDENSYEILGEMRAGKDGSAVTGTAELNLTFNITVESERPEQNLEYKILRKLFIIRK